MEILNYTKKVARPSPSFQDFPPHVDGTLEDLVKEEGGRVRSDLRLRKILVAHKDDDIHVTRAEFDNLKTGTTESVDVRSLEVTSL